MGDTQKVDPFDMSVFVPVPAEVKGKEAEAQPPAEVRTSEEPEPFKSDEPSN